MAAETLGQVKTLISEDSLLLGLISNWALVAPQVLVTLGSRKLLNDYFIGCCIFDDKVRAKLAFLHVWASNCVEVKSDVVVGALGQL